MIERTIKMYRLFGSLFSVFQNLCFKITASCSYCSQEHNPNPNKGQKITLGSMTSSGRNFLEGPAGGNLKDDPRGMRAQEMR